MLKVRPEVKPFLLAAAGFGLLCGVIAALCGISTAFAGIAGLLTAAIIATYMLFFFRDPPRCAPDNPDAIVAAADGHIARLKTLDQAAFRQAVARSGLSDADVKLFGEGDVLRISIFLSLFDVHVNRAPISGTARFLGYFPGKRLFTFDEKSSDQNQHNAILIQGEHLPCLVTQIVGPVCRRVVYWLEHDNPHPINIAQDFGMMKFGSRLDMYFPAGAINLQCKLNDFVRAGESVIATIIHKGA